MSKKEKVYLTTYPHLVNQWHPSKNGDLDLAKITHGSKQTVWWACERCGGEWSARVYNRTLNSSGCSRPDHLLDHQLDIHHLT